MWSARACTFDQRLYDGSEGIPAPNPIGTFFFRVSEESKRQKPPRVLISRPPAGVIENWIETQVADHDD